MIHAHRTRTTAPRRRPTARAGAGLIARAGTGLIALCVLVGACGFGGGDEDAASDDDCTRVPAAVSSEKIQLMTCLLYTSPSPRDRTRYRMPSSA